MLDWRDLRRILRRHDLRRQASAATPWDGLVIGNGEMGAVTFGDPTCYTWRISRNDLWDGRWPEKTHDIPVYPLSEFKRRGFELSRDLKDGEVIEEFMPLPWDAADVPYPCRRIGADFVLRLTPPLGAVPGGQRLSLADATLRSEFTVGIWGQDTLQVASRMLAGRDVLAIRVSNLTRQNRPYLMFALRRDPWGGRTWDNLARGEWGIRNWKDPRAGMLPPAEIRVEGNQAILLQRFPGDRDGVPYTLAVVALQADGHTFSMEESGAAVFAAAEHDVTELTMYVATATAATDAEAEGRARALAVDAAAAGWKVLDRDHRRSWREYWMESAVELADPALERRWYRASYDLACNANAGTTAPGLFGVGLAYDCPPWRGDRHNNWPEYSGGFWGAYPANHLKRALNYTEFIEGFMPTARRIAREIFECDGAAFPHLTLDRTRRYYFDNLWSRTLYLTAAHAQNLWWHYRYSGDVDYLRERAFPILAECADFYVSLVAKNPPGDYTLWPTVPTEYRGFVKDFALNKNMIEDLAMVKFLLRAVVNAAEILGISGEQVARWIDLRDQVPDYATMVVDGQEVFADVAGNTELPPYNHSIGLSPFFPGEDPEVYGDGRLRAIAERTMDFRQWSDGNRYAIAYARLGRVEEALQRAGWGKRVERTKNDSNCTYASGHGNALKVLSELLLSSFDGVIRLFPAWKPGQSARFRDLRAEGGFRLSAACDGATVGPLTLSSDGGNPVTIQLPWPAATVLDTTNGKKVEIQVSGGRITFNTEKGHEYLISTNHQ
ncbi:MAG: glycosyl hydrolase family 95 catalytic domain-containing protein [Armatimonadota bacterium]